MFKIMLMVDTLTFVIEVLDLKLAWNDYIYIKHAEQKELRTRVSVRIKASLHSWKLIKHR
jgi:hypothetical protein